MLGSASLRLLPSLIVSNEPLIANPGIAHEYDEDKHWFAVELPDGRGWRPVKPLNLLWRDRAAGGQDSQPKASTDASRSGPNATRTASKRRGEQEGRGSGGGVGEVGREGEEEGDQTALAAPASPPAPGTGLPPPKTPTIPSKRAEIAWQVCMKAYKEGNVKLFVEFMTKSAEAGHHEAQAWLGEAFERGLNGIAKDEAQAMHWYTLSAEREDRAAQSKLSRALGDRGKPGDKEKAIEWRRRAAANGDEFAH